ncbi:glycoside hydrolase family 5 protein [Candidatus Poribacteria bacterium]
MVIAIDPSKIRGLTPTLRGVHLGDSPQPFVEDDVARLKEEVGVTCIRFGMEPRSLSDEEKEVYHEEGFQYVGSILDWCERYGIHCILDLHNALGRLGGGDSRLWKERYFQDRFVALWEQLVQRFMDHPAVAAYELINEPEPPDQDFAVWNQLHQRAVKAIRQLDPYRTIIVNSIGYARPQNFSGLELTGDPNTVYSFHNYQPGPYHCQKRKWIKDQSTYYYPGYIPHKRPENPLDFDMAHLDPGEAKFWNRQQLIDEWSDVFAFRDRHRVPLFCGEFGCVSDVPEMTGMIYLMDEISIFQEEGIHWTLYNTMYRTDDPYWKDHFDCGIYIYYSPDEKLYRFNRKIALMEFFCRTDGEVLDLPQPEDEWVGVYGVRRLDGSLAILISNKDRQVSKNVRLTINNLPPQWSATLRTMATGDEGFVYQGHRKLDAGELSLTMQPLSLALLTIPAPGQDVWMSSEIAR